MKECMTVKKLIKRLEKFPKDAPIHIDHDENGWFDLDDTKLEFDPDDECEFVNLISSTSA